MLVQKLARISALLVTGASILAVGDVQAVGFAQTLDHTSAAHDEIASHLRFGEFSKALEIAERLPQRLADEQYRLIAAAQRRAGANIAATNSLQRISSDQVRFKALSQQEGGGFHNGMDDRGSVQTSGDNPDRPGLAGGFLGGVTEADFQPLIQLIRSTIDPDSWDDTNGDGTIQAYPAGVYVDSSGTLKKLKIDSRRNLQKLARQALNNNANSVADQPSTLRKVSLLRLEKQAQLMAARGLPMDDVMQNLAGIYEIRYLILQPESKDIIIAGPAGPWKFESDGHAVNVQTGKPVLQLDDLVVCLRNAQAAPQGNHGKFGCSITPRKKNLVETREFISNSNLKGKAWRDQLRETLGHQDIEVFGIDPATHAGRVLVEADYRMKLVAMGLEPSIPEIPSYLSRLTVGPDGDIEPLDVVRWWFTMNYDEVLADESLQIFSIAGTGVKVLSENEWIDEQGDRIHTGQSDGPTAGFARDFTRHFDKIADEYPVYRRLKNLFDLAIVSALIRSHQLDRRAEWNLTFFGNDPEYFDYVFQPVTAAVPHQVDSVLNHRVISQRKESSTVHHTLVGVSGGITFDAMHVLRTRTSTTFKESDLTKIRTDNFSAELHNKWWWD